MIYADPLTGDCTEGVTGPRGRFSVRLADATAYAAWFEANKASFPAKPAPAAPTYSEGEYKAAIQARLDSEAFRRGFTGPDETARGGMVSACSYAGYQNEYQAEAIGLGQWRSAVWGAATAVFKASLENHSTDPAPTPDAFADFIVSSIPCTAPSTQ